MKFTIAYTDRQSQEKRTIEVDPVMDVLAIRIPEQSEYEGQPDWHLPALTIHVNSDAVLIDQASGEKLARYEYTDLLAEAEADSC
jgi:hypothetical protein